MGVRIKWIDATKGIAILLVIIGHLFSGDNLLNRFICSFHMPVFFFVSGYLARKTDVQMGGYIRKQIRHLLIPQAFLLSFSYIFNGIIGKSDWSISIEILCGGWFLWVLFYVEMIWYFLQKIMNSNRHYYIVIVIDLVIIFSINSIGLHTGINIEIVPMALLFFITANLVRRNNEYAQRIIKITRIKYYWFLLIPIVLILAKINSRPVYMYLNDYGNIVLFFCTAFAGIIVTVFAADLFCCFNYLNWIGKHSLVFYIFNFSAVDTAHLVNDILETKIDLFENTIYKISAYGIYFVLIVIVLSIITVFSDRYLWFIFGGKKCQKHRGI